jgi:anterior pharynx defective protein 1
MTAYTFFGCAFTAYGTPFALFLFTITNDPVKVIILILSAFFWLLSLLVSATLWAIVTPLKDELAFAVVFSVLFQELFRLLIYLMLDRADTYLKKLTETEETQIFANKHILAYTVGLGFGLMSGAFSLVNVLADSLGPGTLGFHGEAHNFFIVSSLMTLCMILLHTAWGVIFFSSLETKTYWQAAYVVLTHLLVSCLSLLNSVGPGGSLYPATLIPSYLVLAVTVILAFKLAGGSLAGVRKALVCSSNLGNLTVEAE